MSSNSTLDRSAPLPVRELPHMEMPPAQWNELPNGIDLAIVDHGSDDIICVTAVVAGGSAELGPVKAQMLASTIKEGTADHSSEELAELIDYHGAWIRSYATGHHMVFSLYATTKQLPSVLPLFADMLRIPAFEEPKVAIEAALAASRLNIEMCRETTIASRALDKLIMGADHPLLPDYTPEDYYTVHSADLKAAHSSLMSPRAIAIYLSGHVTAEVQSLVAERFGSIEFSATDPVTSITVPFAMPATTDTIKISRPDSLQSAIIQAVPMPAELTRSHPDYIPLRIAAMALGGYFGSRLNAEIRERQGLTYGISSTLVGQPEGIYLSISTQCDPAYAQRIVAEVADQLRGMATSPLSPDEWQRLRRHYATGLAAQLDSAFSIAQYHIMHRTIGIPTGYFEAQQKALAELTPQKISEICRQYFNSDRLITVEVGK